MQPDDDDIDRWTRQAVDGDARALDELLGRIRPRVKRGVAMRLDPRVTGRIDPSDVVQEAYVDVVRRWSEYVAQSERMPLLLWVRLLAAQRLVDLHRQHLGAQMRDAGLEVSLDRPPHGQTSSVWLARELVDEQGLGEAAAQRAEIQERVRGALESMELIDREVLAMRHFEELSNLEVAQALEISPTAASNRYIRALKRLRAVLSSADQGE